MTSEKSPSTNPRHRFGIRRQVIAVGAVGIIAAGAVGATALIGLRTAGEDMEAVVDLQRAVSIAQDIQLGDADIGGWQVAMAWDARRIGPVAATAPDNPNLVGFRTAADAMEVTMDSMPTELLTTAEQETYTQVRTLWDQYVTANDQAVAAYQQNTDAGIEAGESVILGPGFDVFAEILSVTGELRASLADRLDERSAAAEASRTWSNWIVLATVAIGLVLVLGLAVWIAGRMVSALQALRASVVALAGTTNETSRSVTEAAGGTAEIAVNITGVSSAAGITTQALDQTRVAVDELARMAGELRGSVRSFTY